MKNLVEIETMLSNAHRASDKISIFQDKTDIEIDGFIGALKWVLDIQNIDIVNKIMEMSNENR